mgnify:CR=1 FL=1
MKKYYSEETLNYKQLKKQFLKKDLEIKLADRLGEEKIMSHGEQKQVPVKYCHFMVRLEKETLLP